jgi:hypothetical protein
MIDPPRREVREAIGPPMPYLHWLPIPFGAAYPLTERHSLPIKCKSTDPDPTEGALVTLAAKGGVTRQGLYELYTREREFPFNVRALTQ